MSTSSSPARIAVVAGEASGDLLGAQLIEKIRAVCPDAQFAGIGGPRMREAGMDCWWDCSELAVMGFAEVLRHLPRLLRLRRNLFHRVRSWQADIYVGIDAPDFNLEVERRLKQLGTPTVHYVSPSVWAWREKRAARIGRSADRVLCLFPMEPAIYARFNVDARFVGHPLADQLPMDPDRHAARCALGIDAEAPVLALLPGSRLGEIARLGPVFLGAVQRLHPQLPGLQVLSPMANAACREAFEPMTRNRPDLRLTLLDGMPSQAMVAADVVLLASGTAALECLLAKRPMVVGYRISALTHWIVHAFGLIRTERFALPNVLAGQMLVPELLQDQCTPDLLAAALLHWFENADARAAVLPHFHAIHETLRKDASRGAAAAIVELIRSRARH